MQEVAKIESVELNQLKLIKAEGIWSVAGTKDGEQANAEEINALLNKIAKLRIDNVLGKDKKENYRLDKPEYTLSMGITNGDSVEYQFSKVEGESYYVLKSSSLEHYLRVPDYTMTPFIEVEREKLVQAQEQEEEMPE